MKVILDANRLSLADVRRFLGLRRELMDDRFVCLDRSTPSVYQLFPKLSLLYPQQALQ